MIRLLLALWLLAFAGTAQAHLLPKQNATMKIVDDSANFVVSVPVSALVDVDDDRNGLLSAQEIQQHSKDIERQFTDRFKVTNAGKSGKGLMAWVVPPQTDGDLLDSDYVVILHRVQFDEPPQNPKIKTDLFGTGDGEEQMTMRATLGVDQEVAMLSASNGQHEFFRGPLAVFGDFVRLGIEHILGSLDHLLFLLTVIIAGAGWRYWLGVVTSFTIAHSITLTLSALEIFSIPATIVEPAIAASIVLMAALNLKYGPNDRANIGWGRISIVFACGLIHGFGFASAIGAMLSGTSSLVATLAGFNIGIEIGQFVFLAGVLLIILAFRKVGAGDWTRYIPKLASIVALAAGMILFLRQTELV
ncbi:HupE/UreJ family protein [uncultured Parasphingorhabdus sp.]|uniref:HupE/UreJ family protein n=1 Tax=uncultured Parasphingorhabdus sp. TaxID=2709694 RepID=UPI0030D8615E|tara:strand:+ start:21194 stop:22273 length:1080 start_codon:yes stop_codon:yes gene_type:complete